MLNTLAIANYRSINQLVIPLGRLNVITGANGSGKSNLYKALRLLAETARGGVVNALAAEGGLESTFWAGPETISRRMRPCRVGRVNMSNVCAWGLPTTISVTPSASDCPSRAGRSSPSTRRSSTRRSGLARCAALPVCWLSVARPWSRHARRASGRCATST